MRKVQKTYLDVKGKQVPAKIYRENRGNVRASIGTKAVILRMPWHLTSVEEEKQMLWFVDWVEEQFGKHDHLHNHFFGKGYQDGQVIEVGSRSYELRFEFTENKTHRSRLKNGVITLHLSKHDTPAHLQKSIKHLLSRVVAQDFKPEITRRVNELNELYFKQTVKKIFFKYNHTNWGSCSSQSNINLSTRVLFAPDEVIDYLIIHELAHLIEQNHSESFWKLVRDAMPDYKEKEKWLKDNNHFCNF